MSRSEHSPVPSAFTPEIIAQNELHGYPGALGRTLIDRAASDSYSQAVISGEADYVRTQIAQVSEDHIPLAAHYMNIRAMPAELRAAVGGNSGQKLNNSAIMRRLASPDVDTDTLISVMRWHNTDLSDRQKEFETGRLRTERGIFRSSVTAAATGLRSWLPAKAMGKLPSIEATPVFLDDGFDTILKGANGYTVPPSPLVEKGKTVIIPDAPSDTFQHEFTHGLAGKDESPVDESSRHPKSNEGLYRIFGTSAVATEIEEACTDLIASALKNGRVQITNPTHTRRTGMAYGTKGGKLLHTICTKGVRKIDPRLVIAAQLEDGPDRDTMGEQSADAKLRRALHEAFPDEDIITTIANPGAEDAATMANRITKQYFGRRIGATLRLQRLIKLK